MELKSSMAALVAASFFASAAGATDLSDKAYDEAYPVGVHVNWSGVYVGGAIGYGNANHDLTLSEFFRDYCADNDDETVGFLQDGQIDPNAHETVENLKKSDGKITGDTCETLAEVMGFSAGSKFTVPGDSRDIGNIDGVNSHGVIGGGQIGYDQQIGSWVFGVFGSYNFSGMETDVSFDEFSAKIEKDDEWTAGIRAGRLLSERTMLYGLIGYTQTDYLFTASPDADGLKDKVTFDGVTFGAGLEHALTHNVFIGIEGTHTIYGEETIFDSYNAGLNEGAKITDDLSETRVMGTLKIKLNSF